MPWLGPEENTPATPPPPPRSKGKLAIIISASVVCAGVLVAGAMFVGAALNRPVAAGQSSTAANTPTAEVHAAPAPVSPSAVAAGKQSPSPSAQEAQTTQEPQTTQASEAHYSKADKAYCKWEGKVLRVAASASFRAAVCDINGRTMYLGLDKDTGLSTTLPASIVNGAVRVTHNGYTYDLDDKDFRISKGSTVVAEEPMDSWWGPDAPEMALPGDLGLGQPITYPACDGTGAVVLGTSFDPSGNAAAISRLLGENPGSQYIRTDLSCGNFRGPSLENSNGNSIYAVILLVKGGKDAVCQAMAAHNAGGEWLENNVDPSVNISCP